MIVKPTAMQHESQRTNRRTFLALLKNLTLCLLTSAHTLNSEEKHALQLIGRAYLKKYPQTRNMLRRSLVALLDGTPLQLEQAIQRDLKKDALVYIDGWQFSTTEARLCAWYSLL